MSDKFVPQERDQFSPKNMGIISSNSTTVLISYTTVDIAEAIKRSPSRTNYLQIAMLFLKIVWAVDADPYCLFGCRTAPWRSLVAGAVAGPSLLLTGHKVRHTSMAIYILLRATVLAGRCGLKSERAGWLCKPLSWKHGDTFLMCLSSCQILYVNTSTKLFPFYISIGVLTQWPQVKCDT